MIHAMPFDDGLRARIQNLVSGYLAGPFPVIDVAAEPVAVRCGTAVLYVRLVEAEPPVVRVFSPLLRHIPRSPELLAELNDLNSRLNFQRDSTVYAACELLADTLTAAEFSHTCDGTADAADYYDEAPLAQLAGRSALPRQARHPFGSKFLEKFRKLQVAIVRVLWVAFPRNFGEMPWPCSAVRN